MGNLPSTIDATDAGADAEWCWCIFYRCSSFNPSSLDASTIDASDERIHPAAEHPAGQVAPVDQVNPVVPVNPVDLVDQVDQVDQVGEALGKMKPPSDHREDAAIGNTNLDGSYLTENAVEGNHPGEAEDASVKLEKDAKESKTEINDNNGYDVQYDAKENTAKEFETEDNEKPLEDNTKGSRDFEKVDEKSFEKVDEVAEKVADGMVVEVMLSCE